MQDGSYATELISHYASEFHRSLDQWNQLCATSRDPPHCWSMGGLWALEVRLLQPVPDMASDLSP